jgi:hypothetical protein
MSGVKSEMAFEELKVWVISVVVFGIGVVVG